MNYSQGDEQKVITEFFGGRIGEFLDVGAYDGKTFSNVYQLLLNGWQGISIEASPVNFVALQQLYKNHPVKIICGALSTDSCGTTKFYDSNGDAVGTTEEKNREAWRSIVNFQEIYISQFSLGNFINNFGTKFNFISIDTEGTSANLFRRMLENFTPELWCVEHDGYIDLCKSNAAEHGYKEIHRTRENLLFAK